MEFEGGAADNVGDQPGGRGGESEGQPRVEVQALGEDRRALGSEAIEGGVAERDLPGETEEQAKGDGDDGVEADEDAHAEVIGLRVRSGSAITRAMAMKKGSIVAEGGLSGALSPQR